MLLSGFLFELHVSKLYYASGQFVHGHLLLRSEARDIEGLLWRHKQREQSVLVTEYHNKAVQKEATAPSTVQYVCIIKCYIQTLNER